MSLQHDMHAPAVPFVDQSGQLTLLGRSLVQILWRRTGNAPGVSADDLAFLSVLNSLSAPQDHTARSEAQDAFLAALQPPVMGAGSTSGSGASDAEFLALAPKPVIPDFSEPEIFALMLLGPALSAATSGGGGVGVTSFNGRTGVVTLTSGDVTTALGYTPYDAADFSTDFTAALGAALIAGSNITITDNMDGTFTIASTGSGGGGASWLPLVDGAEPPAFITDGAGVLIAVSYTP